MIRVVNAKDPESKRSREGVSSVFIGRPSPLGNPFRLKSAGGEYTRPESIARYEAYLRERIAAGDQEIGRALNDVFLKAQAGDVLLVCYCAPQACHGDIVKKVVEEALEQRQAKKPPRPMRR